MRDTDLAYLAGIIDSDGFITIQRTRKAHTGKCAPAIYHCLKVGIAGTRTQPHELAKSLFGGNISKYEPGKDGYRDQYQWSVTGPRAVKVIKSIGIYLRVKTKQAELGLHFQENLDAHRLWQKENQKPPYRITESMIAIRDGLHAQMCALNMSRSKRGNGRLLDGREWSEFPEVRR